MLDTNTGSMHGSNMLNLKFFYSGAILELMTTFHFFKNIFFTYELP